MAKASARPKLDLSKITIVGGTAADARPGAAATIPGGSGVELQSAFSLFRSTKEIDFDAFLDRWRKVNEQVGALIADLNKRSFGSMDLNKIEVSIGISGEGSIGIASAKGEASVVLTFKKHK